MKTIQLRLYKGKELLYSKTGEPRNENQTIKLTDGVEWVNYLKYIKAQQLCKVELLSVTQGKEPVKDISLYTDQLMAACKGGPECEILVKDAIKAESKSADDKALRDELKAKAAAKGIEYPRNISTPDLEKLVNQQ